MSIALENIPSELFHDVLLVREICQATLLDKDKRKKMGLPNGSPDTLLISLLGSKKLVRRNEIMENYKNKDGSAIKLSGWHYDKKYIVYKQESIPMKMFAVPNNSKTTITYKGNTIKSGMCVLCLTDNGKINKDKIVVMTQDNFRKQFKVTKVATKSDIRKLANSLKATRDLQKQDKEQKDRWRPVNKKPINEGAIALVIASLVNKNGAVIGYKVRNLKTNKEVDFAISKIKELCRNQKIKNMTIVAKDGKEFLRGVGIRKENLPRVLYNPANNVQSQRVNTYQNK